MKALVIQPLLVILLLTSISSCRTGDGSEQAQKDELSTSNSEEGQQDTQDWPRFHLGSWSMKIAPEWRLDTTGQFGTQLVLEAPTILQTADPAAIDRYSEILNLAAAPLQGANESPEYLQKFVRDNLETMGVMLRDWELLENSPTELGNQQAIFVSYTAAPRDTTGHTFDARWGQWFTIRRDTAWLLTFSGEREPYAELIGQVAAMAESFQFD